MTLTTWDVAERQVSGSSYTGVIYDTWKGITHGTCLGLALLVHGRQHGSLKE